MIRPRRENLAAALCQITQADQGILCFDLILNSIQLTLGGFITQARASTEEGRV